MRFIILTFFIINSSIVFAQSAFAPLNAFWNYYYTSHDGGFAENWTIKVTHDTIIGGAEIKSLTQIYDAIYSLPPNPPPTWQGSAPFGELILRNDSVFYSNWGPETFLFSFNMNINDSILIPTFADTIIAVVDSLTTTSLNGITLKKWKLTKYCNSMFFGEATIIENIGPIDDFLFWNKDGCPPGGGWWSFMCYSSLNLDFNPPCNPLILGSETISKSKTIYIYPNPVFDKLYVELNSNTGDILLYNTSGVLIEKKKVTKQNSNELNLLFNINDLSNGIYFIKVVTENESFTEKIIISR